MSVRVSVSLCLRMRLVSIKHPSLLKACVYEIAPVSATVNLNSLLIKSRQFLNVSQGDQSVGLG